jgi:hypothetical protein
MFWKSLSFTLMSMGVVCLPLLGEAPVDATARQGKPPQAAPQTVTKFQMVPVARIPQLPQGRRSNAYLRAMQQAARAQAMANAFASGAGIPKGFGNGVGVSVTTGPKGRSKVVESYFGSAAKKEGVSQRTYSLPPGVRGHVVGVDATTDADGETQVKRYSAAIR